MNQASAIRAARRIAAGDLGDNRLAGSEDLFLTKLDSEGKVVDLYEKAAGDKTMTFQEKAPWTMPEGTVLVAEHQVAGRGRLDRRRRRLDHPGRRRLAGHVHLDLRAGDDGII